MLDEFDKDYYIQQYQHMQTAELLQIVDKRHSYSPAVRRIELPKGG